MHSAAFGGPSASPRTEPVSNTPERFRYFIHGARPVVSILWPDGSLGVYAMDWDTGEVMINMRYLQCHFDSRHHDALSCDEVWRERFEDAVADYRSRKGFAPGTGAAWAALLLRFTQLGGVLPP